MEQVAPQGLMDWYIRYTTVFRKRNTHKQKGLFLKSLEADIRGFRSDVAVDDFKLHEKDPYVYRNLYVGDMHRANTVICTYYDTPTTVWRPYRYFDVAQHAKTATAWIALSSFIYIALGFAFTALVGIPVLSHGPLLALWPIVTILAYIPYFLIMGQVTRGWPTRHTLVQNTSSVLALLDAAQHQTHPSVAFAFLDGGAANEAGLARLLRRKKGEATVYTVENIGAAGELYAVGANERRVARAQGFTPVNQAGDPRVVHLISATRSDQGFELAPAALKARQLNDANMEVLATFVESLR